MKQEFHYSLDMSIKLSRKKPRLRTKQQRNMKALHR
jgi:hypothetical protein